MNTDLKKKAINNFRKTFFKLIYNPGFGRNYGKYKIT